MPVSPTAPSVIPTGRYSIILPGPMPLPLFVHLTRVTTPRRWTTIEVSSRRHPDEWVEVMDPEIRDAILSALAQVDLETANALYTAHTGACGVCGWHSATVHDRCLARKFQE